MQLWRNVIIFIILLVQQGNCAPDERSDKDVNYPDDTPQDYDDEDTEIDSESIRPIVSGPPEILSKPMTYEVKPGDNVELPCRVINADDHVIVWKKNGVNLYFGAVLMDKTMEKKLMYKPDNSLVIYNATELDTSGNYTCTILSKERLIQIVHRIHVTNTPRESDDNNHQIHVTPGNRVEVNEGQSVTIGCEPQYPMKTEIKWSHKGERLHNGEIVKDNGNFITIKHVTRHHAGRYQCLAEDGSEKPAHEAIEVVVKYAPVIVTEHDIVHTGMGQTTQLACKVFANPRAKVTWLKNQKPITNKKEKKIINEDKSSRFITIEHTGKHDLGTYTCVAANQLGETNKEIIVTATPAKPRFAGGEIAEDETTMILKWHVESFSPIVEYKLEYRRKGETEWESVMPEVKDGEGNQFTAEYALKNLLPGISYEAKLAAKNEFGWSPHSASHKFDKEYIVDEPQNVKGEEKHPSGATTSRMHTVLTSTLLVLSTYISTCL